MITQNIRNKMKIGDKIKIIRDHPHKGETGTYIKTDNIGNLIELDNCPHGIASCYILNELHWKKIK